ncbi:hypothetical protein [Streptomyces sp. NPDC058463]|uniref:hypothetical protein n=1 Tax=Streptomyces sp. NPDC058463 TaxID=3346510 RepID=UPI00365B732A
MSKVPTEKRVLDFRLGELNIVTGTSQTGKSATAGSLAAPLSANLGHAVLLCLQNQDEVASKRILFHRQSERGIPESLKATIPYFLGAVPEDQAALQQQLLQAKRALRNAENRLKAAQEQNQTVEETLLYASYSEPMSSMI